MTEIIPFPQNRYFTVLRALPFTGSFFVWNITHIVGL